MEPNVPGNETDKAAKSNAPPAVITVDTAGKETEHINSTKTEAAASQARTPKHANKVKEGENDRDESRRKNLFQGPQQHHYTPNVYPPHPNPYDGRMGAPSAFQSRDRHSYPPIPPSGPPAIQVSPSGASGRYYPQPYGGGPQPPRYPAPYEQRYPGDFPPPRFDQGFHHGGYRGPMPPFPPPRPYGSSEYGARPSWGPPPPPPPGRHPQPSHYSAPANTGTNTFSRAVSSSFDRSIKSREGRTRGREVQIGAPQDEVSDDNSWKMLNQVHSVDEEEMHKRTQREGSGSEVALDQPGSNSSSLTNSPTEGLVAKKASLPDHKKLTSSLDSLSSVASAQEPIETNLNSRDRNMSPSESTVSLDLMKCPSGGSQLLLPSHQRSLSQFSIAPPDSTSGKRTLEDEARCDIDTLGKEVSELRKAPSLDEPPTKKGRIERKDTKKGSPLSITCSPPHSPTRGKLQTSKLLQPHPVYPPRSPGYFDQPPHYTYSIDSGPPGTTTDHDKHDLHHRRNSSSSSTVTPMNVEDQRGPPAVTQLPSWEIHPQDSFGASVNGGNGLASSFSFQHEYPMLAASASQDHAHRREDHLPLESRNQSFDQGQYGGHFWRTDSMMSYEHHGPYDGRQGFPPPYPPHAPSWGSNASYHSGPGYGPYRNSYPSMMRNYSEDSSRDAPPVAHGGLRTMPPSFQPPPDFCAPPSRLNKSVPENTIMTSPYQPSPKSGPFGWTKEEDSRLTEIMKKYKNPRDWEPIAKEHNRGRTAKECHERWIRYLKPGVRKGQWTDHEDAIVVEAVTNSSEQPFTRWSDLAQRLPGRVGKQIRDRWVNHLNPAINHLPFSREDDLLLWEGHEELGKRWVEIATKYFNSTRSENHIKNRWYSASFKKFIANEFGPDAYTGGKGGDSPEKLKKKKRSRSESPDVGSEDSSERIEAV